MFKNEFQGGPYFEVFSAQGKDSTAHWKLSGSSGIKKEFDKHVRSFVYMLDGSAATTKIQLPKDARQSLSLIQRYLVLQVCIPKGADFSVDVGIQDLGGSKRRLHFSTAIRETNTTPLHSKIPLGMLKRDLWLNFCVDLVTFVSETWMGQTYKSIDSLCISANCRIRRIFTMKSQPPDTTNDNGCGGTTDIDSIPKQCQLAPDVAQATQVITISKVLHYEGKRRPPPDIVIDPGSSAGMDASACSGSGRGQDGYHIAFGTKMPGTAQRKGSGKEGGSSSRAPKSYSAKTRTDSAEDMPPTIRNASAPSTTTRVESSHKLVAQSLQRDRKNSDPGSKHEDPEIIVDKESLRTSHTWTDGADSGKEGVPFVKPHPPREPSADRMRRKPRVKSAGKERTPQAATNGKEDGTTNSVSSSTFSSASSVRSIGGTEKLGQPQKVANEEELAQIMAAMQESRRRSTLKSESESDPSSVNTSGLADDSLDEVINTLKTGLHPAGQYEDSDNEDEDEKEQVFMYSSPPKSAPRHKVKVKRVLPRSQRGKTRRRSDQERAKITPDSDFVRDESSEEEESMMTRVLRRHPTSRVGPQDENGSLVMAAETEDRLAMNGHHLVHSPATRGQSEGTFHRTLQLSPSDREKSPLGSQSRMSISKKSLREIPKDDVRLSQPQKAYSPDKYAMGDLSESSEAAMLQSLRRQTMEDGVGESDEDRDRQPSRHSHLHYSDNSLSDSSDDTSMSTLKGPGMKMKVHNYQDEMTSHFLNHSNPRDWGNVFSPPIVLPSQKTSCQTLTATSLQVPTQNGYGRRSDAQPIREQGETDEEDELDLLYDPVLNCYFDPKTCKYYELV